MIIDYFFDRPIPRVVIIVTFAFIIIPLIPYSLGYLFVLYLLYKRKQVVNDHYIVGLSPRLNEKAKYYIVVLIAVVLALNIAMGLIGLYDKYSEVSSDAFDIKQITQIEYDDSPIWETSPKIHDALFTLDWKNIVKYSAPTIVRTAVIPPIFESILVFSMLLTVMLEKYKVLTSIVIVSLYFGLLHIFQAGAIGTLIIVLGAPLDAWLFIRSKSLYPTIVYHALWNFTIFFQVTFYNLGLLPPIK